MSNDNKPDPHAKNAKLYAEDMAETDRAWLRWEMSVSKGFEYVLPLLKHPKWEPDHFYRRIPQTIRIGEFDVPKPLTEVPEGGVYVVDLMDSELVMPLNLQRNKAVAVKRGVAHATREAAKLHARALLTLTEQEECNDE